MFAFCLNCPVIRVDDDGNRSYFINGISNDKKDEAPGYAVDFREKLEYFGIDGVRLIPVYTGQSNWLLTGVGAVQVVLEMLNVDIYTSKIVKYIMTDLAKNPLEKGETLNLIGYSGGGQLALNVMEVLAAQGIIVNNVVLIATPIAEIWNTPTKISMLSSSKDILSMNIGSGYDNYYVGHLSHWDYFKKGHIDDIAGLVAQILK